MTKKRKADHRAAVKLPPFPWETHATAPGGKAVRLARGRVGEVTIETETELVDGEREAEVITRRARVWRLALPPVLRILNPAAQAAMLDYAEAVEVVGSSGGTSDPTGGGGGGGARGPSLRAISAAERLRKMHAALDGHEMVAPRRGAKSIRRGRKTVHVPLRQIVQWAMIDGLSRDAILRKAGAAPSNELAQDAVLLAIVEVGERLSICCGYCEGATRNRKSRNRPAA